MLIKQRLIFRLSIDSIACHYSATKNMELYSKHLIHQGNMRILFLFKAFY